MSIFTKPLSQLGTADLHELLQDRAVENARLEFKLQVPDKDETLKKLSSFANTFGGFMVIGAKAKSADGRIEDLPGVDVQDGYKQKVVQWCFDGASPPLTVEVSDPIPAPAGNGKVCYVVYTAESDVAPHFLNGRKGVWVRTDEFSNRFEAGMANENELRQLFDRRKLIQDRRALLLERARGRFDTYAASKQRQAGVSGTISRSLLELCIVPRFPARPICEQGKLKSLIIGNRVQWRGVQFPRLAENAVSQHESAIVLGSARGLSMFEANIWGMLFYGTQIDSNEHGNVGIHLYEFVGSVLVFILHAGQMFQALGYSGPILIETALTSIRGIQWLHAFHAHWLEAMPGSVLDDNVAFSITTTSEALRERPDGVAMGVLQYVFFSINWPDLVVVPQNPENLIRRGYEFNSWSQPANLRV